jgi:DNA-binding response OmpR family regulator
VTNRLLLVVSDPFVRQAAREAVVGNGFEVIEIDDGARALTFLRKGAVFAPALPSPSSLLVSSIDMKRRDHGLPHTTLRPAVSAAGDVDIVLLDWSLPGLSGAELITRLRGDGDDRPVVVLANGVGVDPAMMLALGADDVVTVPLHPRLLVARLNAQLRRRRPPDLVAGEVLDRRYRLLQSRGDGRLGAVWRAQHVELGSEVDLGVVDTRGSAQQRALAVAASGVVHPGLHRLRDIAPFDSTRHVVVADPLPATSVRSVLADGGLAPDRAFAIAVAVLDVVVALHDAGVPHGALNTNSIFVEPARVANEQERVIVVDGGTMRLLSTSRRKVSSTAYTAPELKDDGSTAGDVYAVGRLLCHLLTGSPEQMPKHAVMQAIAIAVATRPEERCSARALLRAVAIVGRSRRRKDAPPAPRRA